jgi:hypothetical protein
MNVYKYILRNPVEVGLVTEAERYLYSSLYYVNEPGMRLPFNIEPVLRKDTFNQFEDLNELCWINNSFKAEESDSIKSGLKKTCFAYKKDRYSNKELEPQIVHQVQKSSEELWEELVEVNELLLGDDESEAS